MSQTKVLLVDDHEMVTQGLKMILEQRKEIKVVGAVSNGQEAVDFVNDNHVDLAVMDISMPVMNGLVASKIIKSDYPHVKILVLTTYNHKKLIHQLVEMKVDGCMLKDQSGKRLVTAIERLMSGKSYFDDVGDFEGQAEETVLGEREIQILKAYCLDKSYVEIADEFGLSKLTVKTHLRNIRKKLNLKDASELIEYSINQGLI
jgi:DNA-binding NarL/FixJ family response regulator